eukprot:482680_1
MSSYNGSSISYKNADQRTKDLVNGFIRKTEPELLRGKNNPYYNVPALVNHVVVQFLNLVIKFKEHCEPLQISNNGLTIQLIKEIPRAAFIDECIDTSKHTKISFKIDTIGYIKIGLQQTPTIKDVYFKNRLNSNGQVCDNGNLLNEYAPKYKTGDIITVIIQNNTMQILINNTPTRTWESLDGKYKLGVGMHYENDQVSICNDMQIILNEIHE